MSDITKHGGLGSGGLAAISPPIGADELHITLDIKLKMPVKNLGDVADKVRGVVAELRKHGDLEGDAVFGRTRFPLV